MKNLLHPLVRAPLVLFSSSSVQQPYPRVEIRGEGDPEKVGELEQSELRAQFFEREREQEDQRPEGQQPEEGKAEGPQVEKEEGPGEVEGELQGEKAQRPRARLALRREIGRGRAQRHEQIEDAPHDREEDARRRFISWT